MQQTQSMESGFLASYQHSHGVFDELMGVDGLPRAHWKEFIGNFERLGGGALSDRWNGARRILKNHGVTYNVAGQNGSKERAWELDLMPMLIGASEWAWIEKAVIQRAHLHNMILKDIYTGPQYLLRNGLIPPALLFANPNFLRSCRGIRVPDDVYLHMHAVDLARDPNGYWWALDDRMQSPNGVGYTLENRTVIGRSLQDVFRGLNVRRLNQFFSSFQQNIFNLTRSSASWPRVVLLTPGLHSAAHYEHSLLARFLGYTLVEGGDLSVRDNVVYLKTVEGLQRVDAIVRRVNDTFCDPLELRDDSFLGIPGLVQAARAGNVVMANALGSAVVETPALQASLPELAQHLLGEDLMLPSTRTWWCGEADERDHVLANLDSLIIKNAFPTGRRKTMSGAELTEKEREALKKEIRQHPHEFIGQAPVKLSRAPVWIDDHVESRPVVLRVYVAAKGDSFAVLPGGLTKVSSSNHSPVKGLQLSGGSKDTWVLGDQVVGAVQAPLTLESRPAGRRQSGVPSRNADNFFWLGRYAERLEHSLQLMRSLVTRLINEQDPRMIEQAGAITNVMHGFALNPAGRTWKQLQKDWESGILDIVYQPEVVGGIVDLCGRVIRIVSSVRDRFSGDAWRVLNRLRDFPGPRPRQMQMEAVQSLIHDLMFTLAALTGIEMENMTRGHEWRFLDIGRRIERSQNLCHLLDCVLGMERGVDLLLNPILEICDSSMTYRRRYFSEPDTLTVLDALLLDEANPRALKFNVEALLQHARMLPENEAKNQGKDPESLLIEMNDHVDKPLIAEIMEQLNLPSGGGSVPALGLLQEQLSDVSNSLTLRYFSLLEKRMHHRDFSLLSNTP